MTLASLFPPDLRFVHPWRPYQARVLAELDRHLADERLHVVAAPGAGKTVLGLEVVRRIGRRALILSPTLSIQHQWAERFEHGFRRAESGESLAVGRSLSGSELILSSTRSSSASGPVLSS